MTAAIGLGSDRGEILAHSRGFPSKVKGVKWLYPKVYWDCARCANFAVNLINLRENAFVSTLTD